MCSSDFSMGFEGCERAICVAVSEKYVAGPGVGKDWE